MPSRERKAEYFERAKKLFEDYQKILVVKADNVGSKQFQQIRAALRGKAVVLMGKNTMMRRIINDLLEVNPENPVKNLLEIVNGNIGFIYTNSDVSEIREVINANRVGAAARVGQIAECAVSVPAGPTGCDPGQTSWFQALNVPTKIAKGQIEISSEHRLFNEGDIVGASEAGLLQKLGIRPFTFGLVLTHVYDAGSIFDAKVLDITDDDLKTKFTQGLRQMAAVSMQIGYPTLAAIPHQVAGGVRTLIAVAAASGYRFEQMADWDKVLPKASGAATEEAEAAAEE